MTSISQGLQMNYMISYSIKYGFKQVLRRQWGVSVCVVYMLMMRKWLSLKDYTGVFAWCPFIMKCTYCTYFTLLLAIIVDQL